MVEQAKCGKCKTAFAADDGQGRQPCPACGSTTREIEASISETFEMHDAVGFKQNRPGYKKPIAEGRSGSDYWRDGKKWLQRDMFIDRLANRNGEKVYDPQTEVVLRHRDEPLSEHKSPPRVFNPKLFQAGWYFGEIRTDDVPRFAIEALASGFDGEALRRLSASGHSLDELQRLLPRAFSELGLSPVLAREEAGLEIAKGLARAALEGSIHPYVAARIIWHRVFIQCEALEQLIPFVGLATEYEDHPEHRPEYENEILAEAERLLSP